jgi:hypothetical protein
MIAKLLLGRADRHRSGSIGRRVLLVVAAVGLGLGQVPDQSQHRCQLIGRRGRLCGFGSGFVGLCFAGLRFAGLGIAADSRAIVQRL